MNSFFDKVFMGIVLLSAGLMWFIKSALPEKGSLIHWSILILVMSGLYFIIESKQDKK